MNPRLIAPCGMNCALCSKYLAWLAHPGRPAVCEGCRAKDKRCSALKTACRRLRNHEVEFCFECADFPCDRLERLDRRSREQYGMSMINNLRRIRANGMAWFLEEQERRWRCTRCGGTVCVHTGRCSSCNTGHTRGR
ncbi:MAG TPA: DUF3795 domain-containing protein [Methanoculleus sp.]|nr:DUF3795 domain-containing protein [Methanoculleus sp.]